MERHADQRRKNDVREVRAATTTPGGDGRPAAARAEVVEILSGAVFTLLLAGRLRPPEAPAAIAPANRVRS